ncbi:hypothetical protein WICMUC_001285 [Wickerhamomyces mucosus]|uniref:Uncharacterized protein n=1 Tax=Wickerhamomyces mucosus TaxID=1378264 RepID=A0A9P8PXE9_9ASCO|nr:hypothetical protein WICMUC_001285 [Wickerhamomyces mucosus]
MWGLSNVTKYFEQRYISLEESLQLDKPNYFLKNWKKIIIIPLLVVIIILTSILLSLFAKTSTFENDIIIIPTPKNFQRLVEPIDLLNASAIFNTIENALSPKSSQINPVGVSFIPGIIPKGVLLFHGNDNGEVPEGLQWISFDSEFSYNFIANRPFGPGGPPNGPPPYGGPPGAPPGGPPDGPPFDHFNDSKNFTHGPPDSHKHGRIHGNTPSLLTFQSDRDLNIIFLDGSSAAKTTTGEMDQQLILAKLPQDEHVDERESSEIICRWARSFGFDGIIRLEVSYEGIICDFKDLNLINNVTLSSTDSILSESTKNNTEYQHLKDRIEAFSAFESIQAGVNHELGDPRILLDYRGYQTPLNKTYINPDTYLRRINNISQDLQFEIIESLENFQTIDPYKGTNWKIITNEIISKFSPFLQLINQTYTQSSQTISSIDGNDQENTRELIESIENLFIISTNFVQRFKHNTSITLDEAKAQAIYQYSHPLSPITTNPEILIWSSITKITDNIVSAVFQSFEFSRKIINHYYSTGNYEMLELREELNQLSQDFKSLLNDLNWTSFYQCKELCSFNQVCYTPSWGPSPLGFGFENDIDLNELGLYRDSFGKLRISNELRCLDYKTILERKFSQEKSNETHIGRH